MSFLDNFNLRTYEIDRVVDICDTLISEAKDLAKNYGTEQDYLNLCGYLDNEALTIFNENHDSTELTTDYIIEAYFKATKKRLGNCKMFEDAGISFDSCVNGINSNVIICYKDNNKIYDCEGDLYDYLIDSYIDPIYNHIKEYLGPTKSYPRDWVEDNLRSDEYNKEDILECLENGKITGSIKSRVDELCIDSVN